jgi:4-alpha-glucanotransferase
MMRWMDVQAPDSTGAAQPKWPRAGGVLLHPISLPGPFGVGDLGEAAYRFVDFLAAAKQRIWQVLPLGPTGFGDSPYQSFSAFAGNPLLISPDSLVADGLLTADDLRGMPSFPAERLDYGAALPFKLQLLEIAAERFYRRDGGPLAAELDAFCQREAAWLDDFALFMALRQAHGGVAWSRWEPDVARRRPAAMQRWRERLGLQLRQQRFFQFLFARQWAALQRYATARGVRILGDIPIFVAYDSADVWVHPELFFLDDAGMPTVVAGVPPDLFSATGQLWGNPLYRWEVMAADGFRWWIERVRAALRQVDLLRIDHFIGLTRYWEIPAGADTAVNGRYLPGPSDAFLEALGAALGALPIVAEDLGVITPEVEALRDRFGLPGMRVLQFAFSGDPANRDLPHNYPPHCVAYTGTHDNDTSLGWFASAPPHQRTFAQRYLGRSGDDIADDFIRAVLGSVADTAIVPLQDILALGSEARMNLPGRATGNWSWRYRGEMLSGRRVARLGELTELYGRA